MVTRVRAPHAASRRLASALLVSVVSATLPAVAQDSPTARAGASSRSTTAAQTDGFTFRWTTSTSGERSFRAQQYFVAKGHVGVQMLNLTEGLRDYFGVPSGVGVLIAEVQSGGPADRAGLRPGDVVVNVDGAPTEFAADVLDRISREGGNSLVLEVVRSKRSLSVKVPIELQQTRVVRLVPNLGPSETQAAADQNTFTEMVSPTDLEFTMDQLRLFVGGDGLRRNVERLHRFDAQEFEAKVRALEQELAALQAQLPAPETSGDGEPPYAPEATEPDR